MRGTFEAEEIEVVWICCKKSRGCGDKEDVGLENRTKRCRPVKQWIDVIEEDMRQRESCDMIQWIEMVAREQ